MDPFRFRISRAAFGGFRRNVRRKLDGYGVALEEVVILPDDADLIAGHLRRFMAADTDLIITTGGMSVDPDDVTRLGIHRAGVDRMHYGAAALPGAMCLLVSGTLSRSQQTFSIVPPHIGKLVAYVSSGQVAFGLTSVRIPQGGTNISLGEAQDVASLVDWIPIDRDLEACRHASKTNPPAQCK